MDLCIWKTGGLIIKSNLIFYLDLEVIKIEQKKIMAVKTDSICFVSDCYADNGYDYSYHRGNIEDLYFDGAKAEKTYQKNWFQIPQFPSKIEVLKHGERTNIRYEIKDKSIVSEKYPETITSIDDDDDITNALYEYKYDILPDEFKDVTDQYFLDIVCEVDNYKPPIKIGYDAIHQERFSNEVYKITNLDVKHQWLDKIIFPSILLDKTPASFSSKQMFDITRQYVRENIDNKQASITSDYDFCFTVKKKIKYIEPQKYSYHNLFAKTKKARSKIHYGVSQFKEIEVFEMTHDQSKYNNYSVIPAVFAESDEELKQKIDAWLDGLIEYVNKPLTQCRHCNGTGYEEEIHRASFLKDGDVS